MRILNFLFILLFPFVGIGQISFFRTYSNEGFDRGEGVCQLKDSSYLITGSSSSFSSNSKQAFIMHVDSLGNFLWSKDYGGSESDKGRRIFNVENDGIYVIGQSNSVGTSFYDAYFFKTDNIGNLLFEKRFGGDSYEDIFDAVMLKDTSFIVVGETSSTPNEVENVYIFRVNKFGDRLWTKSLGSNYPDRAKSIKLLNDTIVYIAGEMYDENLMKQRGMLMRMHIDGNVEWTKLYGSETKHGFNDLNIFNDTIRVVGYVYNSSENDRSNLYMSSHLLDGIEIKQNVEYNNGTYTIDFIQNYNNNFLLLKSIKDEPSIPTFEDGYDASAYLYNGDLLFQSLDFKFSDVGDDFIYQMIKTNDDGIAVIGYNSSPQIGGTNVLFVKIGQGNYYNSTITNGGLLAINEDSKLNSSIYPNPVNYILTVNANIDFALIRMYNNLGQYVLSTDKPTINVSNLPEGLYFLSIYQENGELIQTKISIIR